MCFGVKWLAKCMRLFVMSGDFKVDSSLYPSVFKWLESTVSQLEAEEEAHSNLLGTVVYLTTLAFTPVTLIADVCVGTVEAVFALIAKQDLRLALHCLRRKWMEATFQETTFVLVGCFTMITEMGRWKTSYRVTKYVVQELSEHFKLGTPRIFNRIRSPLPEEGVIMPRIPMTQGETILFETYATEKSQFYSDLKAFQEKYQSETLSLYGVTNIFNRLLTAKSPTEVLDLNLGVIDKNDLQNRLSDLREVLRRHYENPLVIKMLKVVVSANGAVQAYLDLPLPIRQEAGTP